MKVWVKLRDSAEEDPFTVEVGGNCSIDDLKDPIAAKMNKRVLCIYSKLPIIREILLGMCETNYIPQHIVTVTYIEWSEQTAQRSNLTTNNVN